MPRVGLSSSRPMGALPSAGQEPPTILKEVSHEFVQDRR